MATGHAPVAVAVRSVRWTAPTPAPLAPPSRGDRLSGSALPGHRRGQPTGALLGWRRVSPVPMMAVPPFHALYAAGFLGAALPSSSPLPWPSPLPPGLGSPWPPCGGRFSTRQASLHAADRWLAPSRGGLDPAQRRRAATKVAWPLLRPDLHRLVIVSFQDAPGSSEGAAVPWSAASPAATRKSSRRRPCRPGPGTPIVFEEPQRPAVPAYGECV